MMMVDDDGGGGDGGGDDGGDDGDDDGDNDSNREKELIRLVEDMTHKQMKDMMVKMMKKSCKSSKSSLGKKGVVDPNKAKRSKVNRIASSESRSRSGSPEQMRKEAVYREERGKQKGNGKRSKPKKAKT